eukprot:COSAG01_NODE_3159_length_6488_cov_8.505400_4_plen_78_part_00
MGGSRTDGGGEGGEAEQFGGLEPSSRGLSRPIGGDTGRACKGRDPPPTPAFSSTVRKASSCATAATKALRTSTYRVS